MSGDNGVGASASTPLSRAISNLAKSEYRLSRDEAGKPVLSITETVDVAAARAYAARRRHKEQALGLKRGAEMVPVAAIPYPTARAIAVKYGIDLVNTFQRTDWTPPTQAELRRLEQIIERELPALKTTEKRFNLRPCSTPSAT